MSTRTTAVLAVLLAVLGAVYFFTEVRGGRVDPGEARRLFAARAEDLETIELRAGGEEILLQRQGGLWRMEKPLRAPGDQAAITTLAAGLAGARSERTLEDLPEALSDFGLDRPELVARFRARADSQWRRLEFGGKNPTGAWAYVRVDERPQVVLVAEALRAELKKTPFDLRDKSVMDVAAERVVRVAIRRGGDGLELERDEATGAWTLVKPARARADARRVAGLVRQVADVQAKAFAAEPATDLKPYGLDRPAVRVELWEREARSPKVLALAEARGRPETLYARNEAGMTVVTVDRALLADLPKDAWDLRDKRLFRYAAKDVKKVRLAAGDEAVAVEREGEDRWRLVEPAAGPADPARVTDLLSRLAGLQADGLAAERAGPAGRYGLDRPELTVTVTRADGTEIVTLLVGKEERARRYVQVAGEPPVYTVPAVDLRDLPRAPDDLRKK